jgi:hypothetical protein
MTGRERLLVTATLAAALCGGAVWGAVRLIAARDAAHTSAVDLTDCRRLAAMVEGRRGLMGNAGASADSAENGSQVTRRIESAAKAAGFGADAIERIEPEALPRVSDGASGNSEVDEKPTTVELRGVTMRQALTFFHAVGAAAGHPSLRLTQARLSAANADSAGDQWDVESTLSYRVRASNGRRAVEPNESNE